MIPSTNENFDPDSTGKPNNHNTEFEKIMKEYKIVIQQLKIRCVNRYGARALDWFGI